MQTTSFSLQQHKRNQRPLLASAGTAHNDVLKTLERQIHTKTNIFINKFVYVKQEEISEVSNLTRQTVSKILKKLRDKKLIAICKGYFLEEEKKQIADSYIVY